MNIHIIINNVYDIHNNINNSNDNKRVNYNSDNIINNYIINYIIDIHHNDTYDNNNNTYIHIIVNIKHTLKNILRRC